jgi:hypothetical protein
MKMMKFEEMAKYVAYIESFPNFVNEEDVLRFSAPKTQGLYLIGNTLFNPHTEEQFYLVKVGISKNLQSRMKNYNTLNPLVFHIDYYTECELQERQCHHILLENCQSRVDKTEEWFRVSKELYFEICEKGFQFFLENM